MNKILKLLEEDCRLTPAELAVMLLPESTDDVRRGETLVRSWETESRK